ncbi:MAG: protein kinase, partial [Planctomycetes bacterium]|nr:protein kinase [Planctomycetota bacterium]
EDLSAATLIAADFSDPKALAAALVERGVLTRFQAERLLDGRYRGFFIDRYELREVLGIGGMGHVYIARDRESGEQVALKVLTDTNEIDPGMLTRLQLEARAGMILDDPHIVKTRRIEHTGAKCFVEMEYVRSVNLHEMIALAGPIPWRQACSLMRQAAAGLHHAHRAGFIHRDVKPANFLVDKNGLLKVLDFGLALAADRPDDEFSLAMIFGHDCLGTADFIAPEQIKSSLNVDARSDVYGLGCTFYAALTGKVPFPYASTAKKLAAQKTESPRPLTDFAENVPDEVVGIVKRMMAKDPRDRFQTAAEVARALKPFSKRTPILFSMNEILSIRADHFRQRREPQRDKQTSDVTAASAWTSSRARLSGTLRQPGIETAVAGDTSPLSAEFPHAPQPLVIMPDRSTTILAAEVADRYQEHVPLEREFLLVSLDGGDSFPLKQGSVLIGRDGDCDLCLNRPGVSARHCRLTFDGEQWHVTDLGSKNGVQRDGEPVKSAPLRVGQRLTIARQHHFRLVDPAESQRNAFRRRLHIAGWSIFAGGLIALAYWLFAD